ncbi:hypothetical protein AtNW77_Chr3g0207371 [Arabidopsis thaliana]|jgi:hypothetical protein|uniref:Uncharacterized protein n=1 Tax=Arabidopsis thaliana TaxID=3702 RepID=A0A1I9LTQ8_ARATH|nr:uncharacterized protein AT3G52075 [Arabidopsis thaliana]ANM65966.1 hypothetical protein AT3G52075 [Arabidopsis thaliana]|eukprot:NP_001327898.1 hypothetical protein AT3G52075 [Arabidopsis thaliana]
MVRNLSFFLTITVKVLVFKAYSATLPEALASPFGSKTKSLNWLIVLSQWLVCLFCRS